MTLMEDMGVVASASLEARRTFIVYASHGFREIRVRVTSTQREHFELHRGSDVPLDRVP